MGCCARPCHRWICTERNLPWYFLAFCASLILQISKHIPTIAGSVAGFRPFYTDVPFTVYQMTKGSTMTRNSGVWLRQLHVTHVVKDRPSFLHTMPSWDAYMLGAINLFDIFGSCRNLQCSSHISHGASYLEYTIGRKQRIPTCVTVNTRVHVCIRCWQMSWS